MHRLMNEFENLRHPGIPDSTVVREGYETVTVYDDRREVVKIFVAEAEGGLWTYGYDIWFNDGRHAERKPSLEHGFCSTRENALLYFLGYIRSYGWMFTESCIREVDRLIGRYRQGSLF